MPPKATYILTQNIAALLAARHLNAGDLAQWCGHKSAWVSKILKGERGLRVEDLDKVADFLGITVPELFQFGVTPLLERRRSERRVGASDRRQHQRRTHARGTRTKDR